jgi:nucleotide-binding universal stress UspA family protein
MRLPRRRALPREGQQRLLVPFADGALDPAVLQAAIRIARAEEAILVPAYLVVVPLEFDIDAALVKQAEAAMPLLEAVETAAGRAGVPVDARIERGRTPIDALERLWEVETFDRILVPALAPGHPGFSGKDIAWMLAHAPSETLVVRPAPGEDGTVDERDPRGGSEPH